MNYLDIEVIKDLRNLNIKFSLLPDAEHDALVHTINESMPFSGSQIAWDTLENSTHFGCELSTEALSLLYKKINEIAKEDIIFIGDHCSEAYSTDRRNLYQVLDIFSELPQHTYIVSKSMTWIACISFEGQLDFADLRPA